MTTQDQTIIDRSLKGLTIKLLFSGVLFVGGIVWGGSTMYYGILSAIEKGYSKNEIQDLEIQTLRVRLDKLEVEVNELKKISR